MRKELGKELQTRNVGTMSLDSSKGMACNAALMPSIGETNVGSRVIAEAEIAPAISTR